MTETRRQELARLCRERRLTCLLIDDLLLMYLCTLPAPRLPYLVDCALPFAHLDPYTTTAGIVPPEIFYGRQRERKQILDPMGSCFICGGRQLGKTALLRDIERECTSWRLGAWCSGSISRPRGSVISTRSICSGGGGTSTPQIWRAARERPKPDQRRSPAARYSTVARSRPEATVSFAARRRQDSGQRWAERADQPRKQARCVLSDLANQGPDGSHRSTL